MDAFPQVLLRHIGAVGSCAQGEAVVALVLEGCAANHVAVAAPLLKAGGPGLAYELAGAHLGKWRVVVNILNVSLYILFFQFFSKSNIN